MKLAKPIPVWVWIVVGVMIANVIGLFFTI